MKNVVFNTEGNWVDGDTFVVCHDGKDICLQKPVTTTKIVKGHNVTVTKTSPDTHVGLWACIVLLTVAHLFTWRKRHKQ